MESARHGFRHGMMDDVLNDESENISLSQLLDIPTQQLILEEVQHNNRFQRLCRTVSYKIKRNSAYQRKLASLITGP
jgi:hypothetical protein